MKGIFVTSVFQNVDTGPGKFANILFKNKYDDIKIFYLTNDVNRSEDGIFKLDLPQSSGLIYYFKYRFYIFRAVRNIVKKNAIDFVLYNNLQDALFSVFLIRDVQHIGMINDDNSTSFRFKDLFLSRKRLKYYYFKFFEKIVSKYVNKIIVNSEYLKNNVAKEYKLNLDKIYRLYKSVDVSENIYNEKKISLEHSIDILFIKSDFLRGGLDCLIDALNSSVYNFNLFVIGPESKEFNSYLSGKKINNNVKINFLGKVSQSQIKSILLSVHIFCTPSLKEGLGVANIEALLFKVPTVFSSCGGIPEVFNFDECGFPSLPGNYKSLVSAIEKCITNPIIREKKCNAGYLRVLKFFNSIVMLKNLRDILYHAN